MRFRSFVAGAAFLLGLILLSGYGAPSPADTGDAPSLSSIPSHH